MRSPCTGLWSSLVSFMSSSLGDFWMLADDFNSSLYPSKKVGGLEDYYYSMNDLANFIYLVGLMDINLIGSKFTWSNRRLGQNLI